MNTRTRSDHKSKHHLVFRTGWCFQCMVRRSGVYATKLSSVEPMPSVYSAKYFCTQVVSGMDTLPSPLTSAVLSQIFESCARPVFFKPVAADKNLRMQTRFCPTSISSLHLRSRTHGCRHSQHHIFHSPQRWGGHPCDVMLHAFRFDLKNASSLSHGMALFSPPSYRSVCVAPGISSSSLLSLKGLSSTMFAYASLPK